MMRTRFMFSSSVAFKWIVSYAVIMLIPLIVSAIIYVQTKEIVEYEIQRAGQAMMKQVQYMIDSEVSQAEKLAMQLSIDNETGKFLNIEPSGEKSQAFPIYRLRQELGRYRANNDFVKGIYVYSGKLDKLLTDETYVDSRTFYDNNRQWIGIPYEEWMADIQGKTQEQDGRMPTLTFHRWGDSVVLMKPLTTLQSDESLKGMLMILLNGSKVNNMLQNVDWVKRGDVYIMGSDNKVLFQKENQSGSYSAGSIAGIEQAAAAGSFREIEDQGSLVAHMTSDTTDWKYVSVFPPGVFWEKAREIRNMNGLGLLACFLIGGLVIVYFARKNYNPVRELVNVFSVPKDEETHRVLDEYSFIRKSVLAALRERDDISSRQYKQMRVLQTYYLARLLKGQAEDGLSMEDAARLHHFNWTTDDFAVLLFQVQPLKENAGSTLSMSHFIVSNILNDLMEDRHRLSFTEMDGLLACVVNISAGRKDKWKEDIEEALAGTLDFIGQKYALSLIMSGSEPHTGIRHLQQAYLQALEVQEYRLISRENLSLWYGDIEPADTEFYLSINDEVVLVNLIKTGDYDGAAAQLDTIMDQIFASPLPIELVKCAMIDLASAIMKSVPQEARPLSTRDEWRPMKRLFSCTTREEFREELLGMLTAACGSVRQKLTELSGTRIGEEVSAFVGERYGDVNLSVSMIGAQFGLAPQYVSRLFKEQTGQGLHDYISQVRINAAKSLLQEGGTIEEVASRVGFSGGNAFIRVFKKYEGITPGRYKNLQ